MRAWLELFRLPNAFTLPGDVLAGFFLAGAASAPGTKTRLLLVPLILASLALYFGGLALNDWFDRKVDARERPGRPIPSGRISARTALFSGAALLVGGVVLASLAGRVSGIVAAAVALLVVLYDGPGRKVAVVGFLLMGLCRGGNLLLGASAAGARFPVLVLVGAVVETIYILAVTAAAKRETEEPPSGLLRWGPPVVLLFGLPVVLLLAVPWWLGMLAALVALVPVAVVAISFRPGLSPRLVPPRIGILIRALVPLQSAFVLAAGPVALEPALVVYALWPLSGLAARRFHGS